MADKFLSTMALLCVTAAALACGSAGTHASGASSSAQASGAEATPTTTTSSAASPSAPSSTSTTAPTSGSTPTSTSTSASAPSSASTPSTASATVPAGVPSSATVYSHIEDMTGWQTCTASCSGGNGTAIFSLTQAQATPSLDGSSAEFAYGGGPAFSHALWSKRLASDGTSTNFVLDLSYYVDQPANPQGLEYAANQQLSNGWYKFSTQCSFADGVWRVWDSQNGGWVPTTAPCIRPPADTWQHLTFHYQRTNGQAVFVSIAVNGQTYSINQAFNPQAQTGSPSIGVHFEVDGDSAAAPYNVWIDEMSLSAW